MAVKIRLKRTGKKKQPTYRVVVADGRSPRDGRFIEEIGRYDPRQDPSIVEIDNDKALEWLKKGAQPTDPVRKLLVISGAWSRFKVARGEIHTVGSQSAPSQAKSKPAPAAEAGSVAATTAEAVAETAEAVAETAEAVAETAEAVAET
ncbi:MAG: 30S ribosomal protein S16, partial [Acidimicrobiia bacterium]|nr:30S ribosomal protein S16 [Acidimicrobiia bacterium]